MLPTKTTTNDAFQNLRVGQPAMCHPLLHQEQTLARQAVEQWLDRQTDEFPYLSLDHYCQRCMFTCKYVWRFAGLQGASGLWYYSAPLCPVLWRFSPYNPLAVIKLKLPRNDKAFSEAELDQENNKTVLSVEKGVTMDEYDIQDILRELAVRDDNGRLIAANLLRSLGYQEPHIKYLSGPIVTQVRTAQVAPWLAKTIIQDRLSMIFYEASARTVGFYATPIEVLTYISEDTQWGRLYAYLTEQMRLRYDNDLLCWELAHPKVTNLSGFDLSGAEGKEYLNLAGLVRYLVLNGAPNIAPASFAGYKYPPHQQPYQNGFEGLFRQY